MSHVVIKDDPDHPKRSTSVTTPQILWLLFTAALMGTIWHAHLPGDWPEWGMTSTVLFLAAVGFSAAEHAKNEKED